MLVDFSKNDLAKYTKDAQVTEDILTKGKKDFRSEIEKQFELLPLQYEN